jgi:hypothetical protein
MANKFESEILGRTQTALFVVRAEHIPRAFFTHCALFDQKCAHFSRKYMKTCTPFFHGRCAHNFQRLNSVSFFKFQENFDQISTAGKFVAHAPDCH